MPNFKLRKSVRYGTRKCAGKVHAPQHDSADDGQRRGGWVEDQSQTVGATNALAIVAAVTIVPSGVFDPDRACLLRATPPVLSLRSIAEGKIMQLHGRGLVHPVSLLPFSLDLRRGQVVGRAICVVRNRQCSPLSGVRSAAGGLGGSGVRLAVTGGVDDAVTNGVTPNPAIPRALPVIHGTGSDTGAEWAYRVVLVEWAKWGMVVVREQEALAEAVRLTNLLSGTNLIHTALTLDVPPRNRTKLFQFQGREIAKLIRKVGEIIKVIGTDGRTDRLISRAEIPSADAFRKFHGNDSEAMQEQCILLYKVPYGAKRRNREIEHRTQRGLGLGGTEGKVENGHEAVSSLFQSPPPIAYPPNSVRNTGSKTG
ncbi:hypothetical protein DFH06DRAFT_1437883 [Mycena polygramma]|nr:hypothetical protein DFH06DRAFT_1437883 [Mycena polygramma]